jgi:hypothetical protein
VCTKLLEEATVIAQPPIENTYIGHHVVEIHAGAMPEGIKLFIDIIIEGRKRYFEVYQAYSLPFFGSEISYFVIVSKAKLYLAVNMNEQLFTILTDEVLYKCKEVYFTVCPAALIIYKQRLQHCLIALSHRKVMLQEKYVEL